jgi:hypothetical protein
MNETLQIIIGILLLIGVFLFSRVVMGWRIRRACQQILKDLESKSAFDPFSAVELPYAKVRFINIGLRDFRPKALQYMIQNEVIGITDSGRYYLKPAWKNVRQD